MSFSCDELFLFTQLLPIGCVLRQIQRLNGREIKVALPYQLYVVGGLSPPGASDELLNMLALFIVFISSECLPELCVASIYLYYDDRPRLALTSEDTAHSRKTCCEVKRHVYLLGYDARRALAGRCRHHRRQPSVMGGVPDRCASAVVSLRRQPCIMYMRVENIYNAQVGLPKKHSPGWQCEQRM